MTTDRQQIEVGGIAVEVVRKEIKHLHVGVYPPAGRVRVAAPRHLDDEAVRLAVISRLGWIRRKQKEFDGAGSPVAAGDGHRREPLLPGAPLPARCEGMRWQAGRTARWQGDDGAARASRHRS